MPYRQKKPSIQNKQNTIKINRINKDLNETLKRHQSKNPAQIKQGFEE